MDEYAKSNFSKIWFQHLFFYVWSYFSLCKDRYCHFALYLWTVYLCKCILTNHVRHWLCVAHTFFSFLQLLLFDTTQAKCFQIMNLFTVYGTHAHTHPYTYQQENIQQKLKLSNWNCGMYVTEKQNNTHMRNVYALQS